MVWKLGGAWGAFGMRRRGGRILYLARQLCGVSRRFAENDIEAAQLVAAEHVDPDPVSGAPGLQQGIQAVGSLDAQPVNTLAR